jgi:hypothetical protein
MTGNCLYVMRICAPRRDATPPPPRRAPCGSRCVERQPCAQSSRMSSALLTIAAVSVGTWSMYTVSSNDVYALRSGRTHPDRSRKLTRSAFGKAARPVERHVLDEVRDAELAVVLEDRAGVDHEPELRPLLRKRVAAHEIVEAVRQAAAQHGAVEGEWRIGRPVRRPCARARNRRTSATRTDERSDTDREGGVGEGETRWPWKSARAAAAGKAVAPRWARPGERVESIRTARQSMISTRELAQGCASARPVGTSRASGAASSRPTGATSSATRARFDAVEINSSFYRQHRAASTSGGPPRCRRISDSPSRCRARSRTTRASSPPTCCSRCSSRRRAGSGRGSVRCSSSFRPRSPRRGARRGVLRYAARRLTARSPGARHESWFAREQTRCCDAIASPASPPIRARFRRRRSRRRLRAGVLSAARLAADLLVGLRAGTPRGARAALRAGRGGGRDRWCIFDNTTLGAATGNALALARCSG